MIKQRFNVRLDVWGLCGWEKQIYKICKNTNIISSYSSNKTAEKSITSSATQEQPQNNMIFL